MSPKREPAMTPRPARSSTGKLIRRNHMKDLAAKSRFQRARRGVRLGSPERAKQPAWSKRPQNCAGEAPREAGIIEYPRPQGALASLVTSRTRPLLFALHLLDLLLAFNVNYI